MRRIICIGNRYLDGDAAGARVFEALSKEELPAGVEVIDGGTAGLNLLGLIDGAEKVVFVDAVSGYASSGTVVLLNQADVPPPDRVYDHAAGLPYLLAVLPRVCERTPEVTLVGIEGRADAEVIAEAARVALLAVSRGRAENAAPALGGNHVVAG
jgi:hydrogenase maturation protease